MSELQKLMDDIREWSDATFGEGQRTIPLLHHLIKEVPEVIDACKEATNATLHGKFEFADCFMLLLDAANHYGMTAEDLKQFISLKLGINKKRKWGKPDVNGGVEHIPRYSRKFQKWDVQTSREDYEYKEGIRVWMEGYSATGQSSCAQLLGIFKCKTFDEAVGQYNETFLGRRSPATKGENGLWQIWACNLYDNEIDARKSFG